MKNCVKFILIMTLLCHIELNAQEVGDAYPASLEIIQDGVGRYDEGYYNEAIAQLKRVPNGDTLYDLAQFELALSYQADSQYVAALEVIDAIQNRPNSEDMHLRAMKLACLDGLGRIDESFAVADQLIADYPYQYTGHHEKGAIYMNQGDFENALKESMIALELNPFRSIIHARIGLMAAEAKQPALGIMALYFACILESQNAGTVVSYLSMIENIAADKMEPLEQFEGMSPSVFAFAEEFESINEVVRSQAALNAKYKSLVKSNYNYSKQLQVICEMLPKNLESDHELLNFYHSFYKSAWDDGHFKGLAIQPIVSINTREIQSLAKKYKKPILAFSSVGNEYLNKQLEAVKVMVDGKEVTKTLHIGNGKLIAIGEVKNNQSQGPWEFFHENGVMSSKGSFKNDKREGDWEFYANNGQLVQRESYVNGLREGEWMSWTDYGVPKEGGFYENDKPVKEVIVYQANGALDYKLEIENNQVDGNVYSYASDGTLSLLREFDNGKQVGKQISYYPSGQVEYELPIVDTKVDGKVSFYNRDGKVVTEGAFVEGKRSGTWKWFSEDGTVVEEGAYENGKKEGEWKTYQPTGELAEINLYKGDKLNGLGKLYDRNGVLLAEINYRNGKGVEYSYFNEDGSILHKADIERGQLKVQNYNTIRIKISEGAIEKDEYVGEWKYYYPNGVLSTVKTFVNDEIDGIEKRYHQNGQLKSEVFYEDGIAQGFYKRYNEQGTLIEDGYYLDGQLHGPLKEYFNNGDLSTTRFFWKGEFNGDYISYFPNGKEDCRFFYRHGVLTKVTYFSPEQEVVGVCEIPGGIGPYTLYHSNGAVALEGQLQYGTFDGMIKQYSANGKLTKERPHAYGHAEGLTTAYYMNGNLLSQGMYKNGQKDGEWKYYHIDGSLDWMETYKDGDLEGKTYLYHRNGKVYQERNYHNDERDGELKYFSSTGELAAVFNYFNGVLLSYSYPDKSGKLVQPINIESETGTIVCYYSNGKKSLELNLVAGEFDGSYKTYHFNGKPFGESNYDEGVSIGKSIYKSANGTVLEEVNYDLDDRHGVHTFYGTNGKKLSEINMDRGYMHGSAKYYDKNGKVISEGEYYYNTYLEKK